jgi:hypothetical protein
MGRYYSGDIDGKFWFAVQSSNAADRFGVTGYAPNYLEYHFEEDDLSKVNQEIDMIQLRLGSMLKAIEDFFSSGKGANGYNDEMLQEANISPDALEDYADLLLGRKIRDCIMEQGSCSFTAEL